MGAASGSSESDPFTSEQENHWQVSQVSLPTQEVALKLGVEQVIRNTLVARVDANVQHLDEETRQHSLSIQEANLMPLVEHAILKAGTLLLKLWRTRLRTRYRHLWIHLRMMGMMRRWLKLHINSRALWSRWTSHLRNLAMLSSPWKCWNNAWMAYAHGMILLWRGQWRLTKVMPLHMLLHDL